MYKINCFLSGLILILVTTSCDVKAQSPLTNIKTGPTQTVDLKAPMPKTSTGVELNLEFIAGELNLSPGARDSLASGTATYNAPDFEPKLEASGSSYTLKAGEKKIEGLFKCPADVTNRWEVQLANTPMSLSIKAGAYDGSFELGGLSLEKLYIDEAGSDVSINFSKPNRVKMSSFTYLTGGSSMVLKGLANANFEQMGFQSGAGEYTLSFDGELQRDANVTIDTGAATVTIIIPEGVNAVVTFDGGLTGIKTEGGWSQNGSVYTLSGNGPAITINVKMGMGSLNLKTG